MEYMKDRNGTQAAIRAGYSELSAPVTASRLLRYANVRARLKELESWYREATAWTLDKWIAQVEEDHALFRKDPKSSNAATRCMEMIGRATGLVDDSKLGGPAADRSDLTELVKRAVLASEEDETFTRH